MHPHSTAIVSSALRGQSWDHATICNIPQAILTCRKNKDLRLVLLNSCLSFHPVSTTFGSNDSSKIKFALFSMTCKKNTKNNELGAAQFPATLDHKSRSSIQCPTSSAVPSTPSGPTDQMSKGLLFLPGRAYRYGFPQGSESCRSCT